MSGKEVSWVTNKDHQRGVVGERDRAKGLCMEAIEKHKESPEIAAAINEVMWAIDARETEE